jgi:pimeloyl-ACP methyl ester carboxylesterase
MSGLEPAHFEARSLQLSDGETTVSLRQWGDETSPAIVYLHGLTPWAEFELNEAAPAWAAQGFRVIAPVAPGLFGGEALAPDAYTPTSMAALTRRLLDSVEVARATIVGYSWGGSVAVRFAADAPAGAPTCGRGVSKALGALSLAASSRSSAARST